MKNLKAIGAGIISAKVLNAGEKEMIEFLYKLFNKVWREENWTLEWLKMIVNEIDLSNSWAILLLSFLGKVLSHILLQGIKQQSQEFILENQYGFRPRRRTADATFMVWKIVEKVKKHVHFDFINFKSPFNTIWIKALWKMLSSIAISKKIIKMREKLYRNSKRVVTIDGKLTEWFGVLTGVRQGCVLSRTLFNILKFVINEIETISDNVDMDKEDLSWVSNMLTTRHY